MPLCQMNHKSAKLLCSHSIYPTITLLPDCAAIWDANKGVRVRKLVDHSGIVNTCSIARVSIWHFRLFS